MLPSSTLSSPSPKDGLVSRWLSISDRDLILDLIDSRVKLGVHTAMLDFRRMMSDPQTYDQDRLFGTFDHEGVLRSLCVARPINSWCYMIVFSISRRAPVGQYMNAQGYNAITQQTLEYTIRQMEADGFYIIYSARPARHKWIRTEENPDRTIVGEYETNLLEHVPADTEPSSHIGRLLLQRLADEPMNIMIRRRIGGRPNAQ